MNWIILIAAGLCEVGFAYLPFGKAKVFIFHEPATFWRLFFLTTLIASIVGPKAIS